MTHPRNYVFASIFREGRSYLIYYTYPERQRQERFNIIRGGHMTTNPWEIVDVLREILDKNVKTPCYIKNSEGKDKLVPRQIGEVIIDMEKQHNLPLEQSL